MKLYNCYFVNFDHHAIIGLLHKKSNGTCHVRIIYNEDQKILGEIDSVVHKTALDRPEAIFPKPKPRFHYIDPAELMKLGTEYWGTCVKENADAEAKWIGAKSKPLVPYPKRSVRTGNVLLKLSNNAT